MSEQELFNYWFQTAEEDWDTARGLLGLNYRMQALFFVHIALEKYLKGLIVQQGDKPPYDHNLLNLAQHARLDLDPNQLSHLTEINTFNIRARYDDYKRSFYKRATPEYTNEYFKYAEEFIIWLKSMYQTK